MSLNNLTISQLDSLTISQLDNLTVPNTAPVLTLPTATATVNVGHTVAALASVTVADADADLLTCTITIPEGSTLSLFGQLGWNTSFLFGQYTKTRNAAASAATIQSELRAMLFPGVAAGVAHINVVVNDGTVDSNTVTSTVTVISANGFPGPGPILGNE